MNLWYDCDFSLLDLKNLAIGFKAIRVVEVMFFKANVIEDQKSKRMKVND